MKIETFKAISDAYHKAKEELEAEYAWEDLAVNGLRILAMAKYARTNKSTPTEARDAVIAYIQLVQGR